MSAPALGEDTTSDAAPPPDTTTTVPGPAPLENPPPATTTPSTEAPADVTDSTSAPPPTEGTLPPATDPTTVPPATTNSTTATSTPPTTGPASTPAVPGADDSSSSGSDGGGTTPTGEVTSPQTPLTKHDGSLPLEELVQPMWGSPLSAPITKPGALTAKPAVSLKPVKDAMQAVGEGLGAAVRAPWNPQNASGSWGDLGSAAPRFGPWIILLAMAWLVRTVIASILADRTAGPRRRRWTLL